MPTPTSPSQQEGNDLLHPASPSTKASGAGIVDMKEQMWLAISIANDLAEIVDIARTCTSPEAIKDVIIAKLAKYGRRFCGKEFVDKLYECIEKVVKNKEALEQAKMPKPTEINQTTVTRGGTLGVGSDMTINQNPHN